MTLPPIFLLLERPTVKVLEATEEWRNEEEEEEGA